jgi:hypothetical protein
MTKKKEEEEGEEVLVYRVANLHYIVGRLDAAVLQWSVVLFEFWEILVKVC